MRILTVILICISVLFSGCGYAEDSLGEVIENDLCFYQQPENVDLNPFTVFGSRCFPLEKYYVSSEFGYRYDPFTGYLSFHEGVDLAAKEGSEIKAAFYGQVIETGVDRWYGHYLLIQHDSKLTTLYAVLN